MPILVVRVECNGNESGLLECAHVTGSDVAVTQCDLRESAAVACQGMFNFNTFQCLQDSYNLHLSILYVYIQCIRPGVDI